MDPSGDMKHQSLPKSTNKFLGILELHRSWRAGKNESHIIHAWHVKSIWPIWVNHKLTTPGWCFGLNNSGIPQLCSPWDLRWGPHSCRSNTHKPAALGKTKCRKKAWQPKQPKSLDNAWSGVNEVFHWTAIISGTILMDTLYFDRANRDLTINARLNHISWNAWSCLLNA